MSPALHGGKGATAPMAVATTLVIASTPRPDPSRQCGLSLQSESHDRAARGAERHGVRVVVAGATLEVVSTGGDDPAFSRQAVETRTVVRRDTGQARQPRVETLIACRSDAIVPPAIRRAGQA